MSQDTFEAIRKILFKRIEIAPTNKPYKEEALRIIGAIDAPLIAACLAYNAPLWSDDKALQRQNAVKVLTTKEVL